MGHASIADCKRLPEGSIHEFTNVTPKLEFLGSKSLLGGLRPSQDILPCFWWPLGPTFSDNGDKWFVKARIFWSMANYLDNLGIFPCLLRSFFARSVLGPSKYEPKAAADPTTSIERSKLGSRWKSLLGLLVDDSFGDTLWLWLGYYSDLVGFYSDFSWDFIVIQWDFIAI